MERDDLKNDGGEGTGSAAAPLAAAVREVRALEARRTDLVSGLERARRGAGATDTAIEARLDRLEALKQDLAACERSLERARERVPLVMDLTVPGVRAERLEAVAAVDAEARSLDAEWLESSRRLEGLDAELARIKAEASARHRDIEERVSALGRRRLRLAPNGARAVPIEAVVSAVPWTPPDDVLITGAAWRAALAVLQAAGVTRAVLTVDETTGTVRRAVTNAGTWVANEDGALVPRPVHQAVSTSPAVAIELNPDMHRASRPSA